MKVKDLINKLLKHQDKEIYFSQDEEGNAFMSECEVKQFGTDMVILYPYKYARNMP